MNSIIDRFVEQQKKDTTPTVLEVAKNHYVEKLVIDSIVSYIMKQPYSFDCKYVATQGSFAKGTDLAGSSDLDIFVSLDSALSLDDLKKHSIDLGENVLKGMADKGSYKLMTGAKSKKYGEANVNGVEVQIIVISDVTLDDIKNGKKVSDQDRSPHHTSFMKKALKGKESEVRVLKRFLKDTGVYDASQKKQGFSGLSTEVLTHNLGSFENVMKYFANFEKGSTLGNYKGNDKTPIRIADPIDPNRNLGSAFSQQDGAMNVAPNKNLARLIKASRYVLENGKVPEITKVKMPSLSLNFDVPKDWGDSNKVAGQLQHVAGTLANILKKEGYNIKAPTEKISDNFVVAVPRINVNHNEETCVATIDFGLDNFVIEKTEMIRGVPLNLSNDKIEAYKSKHQSSEIIEKDGFLWMKQEKEYTNAYDYLNHILKNEIDSLGLGKMTDNIRIHSLAKGDKEYENLTD